MAITVDCTVGQMATILATLGVTAANSNLIVYSLGAVSPVALVNNMMVLDARVGNHIFTPRQANGDSATEAALLGAFPNATRINVVG